MVYYVVRVCQSTHCNVQFMHVYACGPKTVLVNRTFLKNAISEVGVGWGACQRSLYFVHYSLLRCRDLWDRCYVT